MDTASRFTLSRLRSSSSSRESEAAFGAADALLPPTVATPLPAVAASVAGPARAAAAGWSSRASSSSSSPPSASSSSTSGVDPPVLAIHAGALAREASFISQGLLSRHVTVDHASSSSAAATSSTSTLNLTSTSSQVVGVVSRKGLSSPSPVPVPELGEVAALGGRLPLLVGLVRVLVGEVGGLGSVAVVVLDVGLPGVALVVVVMVVTVCVVEMPPPAVTVGRRRGVVVVSVLGVARRGRRGRGAVAFQNRIQGRRGGPSSPDHSHSAVDSRGVLLLLQFAEAGGLILLMLGSPVAAAAGRSLKPAGRETPVGGNGERVRPSGVWRWVGGRLLGHDASVLSGGRGDGRRGGQRRLRGRGPLALTRFSHLVFLLSSVSSPAKVFGPGGLRRALLLSSRGRRLGGAAVRRRAGSDPVPPGWSSDIAPAPVDIPSSSVASAPPPSGGNTPGGEDAGLGAPRRCRGQVAAAGGVGVIGAVLGVGFLVVFLVGVTHVTGAALAARL
ncbi:hypothetical protein EYF80_030087 [Liparis tanakae]|uniref:Uncharacterized protein n=1 Tax=Liparis tanakae TaxID=230148 RepID=A0A4Z2H1R5_9TELE|nr:hypothetical protein EYF80_030087 [Liparis tanakae]